MKGCRGVWEGVSIEICWIHSDRVPEERVSTRFRDNYAASGPHVLQAYIPTRDIDVGKNMELLHTHTQTCAHQHVRTSKVQTVFYFFRLTCEILLN